MYLARHGQTMFNVIYGETRKDPGIVDPPLTDEGRRQAEALGRELRARDIARIVASPYTRALETAGIVAGVLGVPVTIECDVRERTAFFCDIGTEASRLASAWPHLDFARLREVWWNEAEETVPDFHARCAAFRKIAAGLEDWNRLAVITHWGVIRSLTGVRAGNAEAVRCDPKEPHPPFDLTWP
ncbi:MAG: histidine phosphatase family protein [Rhodospirillaceae bacterium]